MDRHTMLMWTVTFVTLSSWYNTCTLHITCIDACICPIELWCYNFWSLWHCLL